MKNKKTNQPNKKMLPIKKKIKIIAIITKL